VGVNVFWKMCGVLAAVLENYDIEIIETHHDKKKDAPSGTATKAAQIVSEVTGIDSIVYGRQGWSGPRTRDRRACGARRGRGGRAYHHLRWQQGEGRAHAPGAFARDLRRGLPHRHPLGLRQAGWEGAQHGRGAGL